KLTVDLAGLRKEKEDLLKKLESSSDITSLVEEVSKVMVPQIQVTTLDTSRSMDLEIKQLQCKLKVKTLTEECSNKKVSVDSLKQRLNVAVKEKSQYEQMYHKTKEELEKKDLKLSLLTSKINETETAMAQIETAASKQLQGLALQSEQVLESAQKKLLAANEKLEEFAFFVKALVKELQSDVHRTRHQIKELKKMQKDKHACKTSTHKVQTLAASILNISPSDLEEILDTENEMEFEKTKIDAENDKEWLLYIQKLLEGQLPFASYLLEAILEKISENKKLTEGYLTVMKDIR
ncbi:Centlein, partial [Cricetulus griseus]